MIVNMRLLFLIGTARGTLWALKGSRARDRRPHR